MRLFLIFGVLRIAPIQYCIGPRTITFYFTCSLDTYLKFWSWPIMGWFRMCTEGLLRCKLKKERRNCPGWKCSRFYESRLFFFKFPYVSLKVSQINLLATGYSFAYVVHFVFLRDVRIRTQSAAVASWHATNLAAHLPKLSRPSPSNLAAHLPPT